MKPIVCALISGLALLPPGVDAVRAAATAAPDKPNIVFILADDLGLGEVGCYGSKVIRTPNIDRLAGEGLRFTRAYSGSAVCAPTRCVLMTGLHTGHGTRRANGSLNGLIDLKPEEVTVAEKLREAGYATGGFGKWGLGDTGTTGAPERQGFDLFYGYYGQVHAHSYFPTFLVRNGAEIPLPGNVRTASPKPGKGTGTMYAPDLILKETLGFIDANRDRPFFCYCAWTLPHGDYEVPAVDPEFAAKPWPDNVKAHATMIKRLDADVGAVMARLAERGLDRKTLVLFSSDNGADGPGRVTFDGAGGLRGYKRHLYEGGIRCPLIARWPGRTPAGGTSDLLACHTDLMPTVCELAGVATPPCDGVSLAPVLTCVPAAQKLHEHLYWEIYEKTPAPFQQAVRVGDWKGYRRALRGPLELYRLTDDPAEATNVAAQHPDVAAKIEAIMAREHVANPNWAPVAEPAPARPKTKRAAPAKAAGP